MHDRAEETVSALYRRHARECLEIANKVQSDEVRACLMEMALVLGPVSRAKGGDALIDVFV